MIVGQDHGLAHDFIPCAQIQAAAGKHLSDVITVKTPNAKAGWTGTKSHPNAKYHVNPPMWIDPIHQGGIPLRSYGLYNHHTPTILIQQPKSGEKTHFEEVPAANT